VKDDDDDNTDSADGNQKGHQALNIVIHWTVDSAVKHHPWWWGVVTSDEKIADSLMTYHATVS
jgi:hypothetical protein